MKKKSSRFEMEAMGLVKTLREFREWVDQNQKKNVRFMKAYKERIQRELGPILREFDEKYGKRGEGESRLFRLILEVFSTLRRPVSLIETQLRPSVGMGVFLERWMMRSAVESYLKECCEETDRLLGELTKEIEVRSQK